MAQDQPHHLVQNELLFLENKGQIQDFKNNPRPDIKFTLKAPDANVYIGNGKVHYQFSKPLEKKKETPSFGKNEEIKSNLPEELQDKISEVVDYETYRLDISLIGSNLNATKVLGEERQEYYENYYNVPGYMAKGIIHVYSYKRIIQKEVYPNIDWIIYIKEGKLKHEFILHPGADYKQIRLQIGGANKISVSEKGELLINTPLGEIAEDKPIILGQDDVNGAFQVQKTKDLEFEVSYELESLEKIKNDVIIDPGVVWSTYYGGAKDDEGYGISVDENNNIYFGGNTLSISNIASGGHSNKLNGNWDMFIVKMDSNGKRLWSTYYGGDEREDLHGIRYKNGLLGICGHTYSDSLGKNGFINFKSSNFESDGIVAVFHANGTLKWSTYHSSRGDGSRARSIDIANNKVIVVGRTKDQNNYATPGAFKEQKDFHDYEGYLVCYDTNGTKLWGTYVGGKDRDDIYDVKFDSNKYIYFTGWSNSDSFLSMKTFQKNRSGLYDGIVGKFDTSGKLIWSSYMGGPDNDYPFSLEVSNGNMFVGGMTYSTSGFSSNDAFQKTFGGGSEDAIFSKINNDGSLNFSSYYGKGNNSEQTRGMQILNDSIVILHIASGGGNRTYAFNGYLDDPKLNWNSTNNNGVLISLVNTNSKSHIYSTFFYGKYRDHENSNLQLFKDGFLLLTSGKDENLPTIRWTHQKYRSNYLNGNNSDAILSYWSIPNFSKITLPHTSFCQGTNLELNYIQYAVGRGTAAKTFVELSDTNGEFNSSTRVIFTRNDTLTQEDKVKYLIPDNLPPGNNYRVRTIMSYPIDTSEASEPFIIYPRPKGKLKAVANNEICDNDSLKLELDASTRDTLRWYFGSDTTNNYLDTAHLYYAKDSGFYRVRQINEFGCVGFSNLQTVNVKPIPMVNFGFRDSTFCPEVQYRVYDSSVVESGLFITKRKWDFGNGDTSNLNPALFSYDTSRGYIIKLSIGSNNGCSESFEKEIIISPKPKAGILVNNTESCLKGNTFELIEDGTIASGTYTKEWLNKFGLPLGTKDTLKQSYNFAGTYPITLKLSSDKGCADTGSIILKVHPQPEVQITSDKAEYCQGEKITITANEDSTYIYFWQKDRTLIGTDTSFLNVTETGLYKLKVENPFGCDSTSNEISITVSPNPKPDLKGDFTLVNDRDSTLNPGDYKAYDWSTGDKTQTLKVDKNKLTLGTHDVWVEVTDTNNCSGSDTVNITIKRDVGLNDPSEVGIKVFPNPTSDVLNIKIPAGIGQNEAAYKLTFLNGQIIQEGSLKQLTELNLKGISKGTYLLLITMNGIENGLRVVKQ